MEDSRHFLNIIREMREKKPESTPLLVEEEQKKGKKAIAITDDPRFGQTVLTNQIDQFRSSVESGAQFAEANEGNVAESPLIFMPETGNLVFSGIIPCLNNLKWQFVLKTSTGNGCFIWGDGVIINKDNLQVLNKLFGFYQNWREQWNSEASDLEKMVKNTEE